MANIVHIQSNFTAGEISPRLFGRVDLNKYNNGAKTIQNAVVQTHGGVSRRPGTRFASQIKDTGTSDIKVPILVEFHYNAADSYVLELGATHLTDDNTGYMRPYRIDANGLPYRIKTSGGADVEIATLKWNYTDLANLRFCQSADTMFIFNPRKGTLKLQRVGAEDEVAGWSCTVLQDSSSDTNTFVDGPYLSMNGTEVALQCTTVQDEGSEVQEIKAYTDDTASTAAYPFRETDEGRLIRIEDPVKGHKIVAFSNYGGTAAHGTSTVTVDGTALFDAVTDGGYTDDTSVEVEFYNITRGPTMLDGTLHLARGMAISEATTVFQIYHADTGGKEPYTDNDDYTQVQIDGFVRITPASNSGWGIITAISGEGSDDDADTFQTVTVTVKKKFISGEASRNWRLGAWSDTTGYPSTGTFHQNRLWLANTTANPDTVWASETNVYDSFSPNDLETGQVVDSQAMNITLASQLVNSINHMKSDSQGLMVFTEGGEWLGRATNPNAPITPTDISFTKQSTFGSQKKLRPVRLGVSYLCFQRDAATLREYTYEFAQDRFNAPNQTLLAEHITRNRVTDVTFQLGTTQRLWCCTETGELLSLTYDKEQQVVAWSKHVMAASGTGSAATATVRIATYTELNTGDKVNLIATDGTNYDFVNGDQSSVAGTWESTTSNDATATNLMNVINTSSGPSGTRFTATVDGAVVTITQVVVEGYDHEDGNTTVTLTDSETAGMAKTDFTGGVVEDTVATVHAVARTTDTNDDNIWMLIKRKVGTVDKYYIEMMVNDFEVTDLHKLAFFVESGLSGEDLTSNGGAGTTIWGGLDHLSGEVVYALADSVQYGPFTVGNVTIDGVTEQGITLGSNANNVSIGLKYKTILKTVPLNVTQSLESKPKRKRIFKAFANMYRSLSGKLGTEDQTYDIIYSAATTSPPDLRIETAEVSFPDNSDRELIVVFEQDDIHPSNLLSITSEIHLGV